MPGMCSVIFDLLAKTEDIVVDRSRLGRLFETPYVSQKVFAWNNFPFVDEEILEQLKLAGVGSQTLATFEQLVADEIDVNIAKGSPGEPFLAGLVFCQRGLDEDFQNVDFALRH
jgi:hypothetical protein